MEKNAANRLLNMLAKYPGKKIYAIGSGARAQTVILALEKMNTALGTPNPKIAGVALIDGYDLLIKIGDVEDLLDGLLDLARENPDVAFIIVSTDGKNDARAFSTNLVRIDYPRNSPEQVNMDREVAEGIIMGLRILDK